MKFLNRFIATNKNFELILFIGQKSYEKSFYCRIIKYSKSGIEEFFEEDWLIKDEKLSFLLSLFPYEKYL